MRHVVPLFLACILAASAVLARARLLEFSACFVLANVACLLTFSKFTGGERSARWDTARQAEGVRTSNGHA